jgi:hypothetical protein
MDSKGVAADPNLFAPTGVEDPMLNDWIDRRLIIHDIPTAPPTPLVIAPFLSTKDWREFYANVVTACGGRRNPKTGVLYLYLTREHTAVTPAMLAAAYNKIDDELIATTLHQGVQFANDNRELFLAISTAVASGPLLTHVDNYRTAGNGRGAFLALRILCDNQSNARAQSEITKRLLKSLYWNRGAPEFKKFVEQSLRCHQDLERYGHPLDELNKVLNFRSGVASHPKFEGLMTTIEGTHHVASFQAVVEFTRKALVITGVINAPARSESRRVAAARIRGGGRSDTSNRDNNKKPGKSGKEKDKRSSKGKTREHPKARHPSTTRNYGRLPKSKVPIQLEPYPREFYDSIVEHREQELLKTERDKIKAENGT